ncbi:MAG: hypothetical protein WCA16_10775, partial [Candidatus Sulfotelmatobacter sp.]
TTTNLPHYGTGGGGGSQTRRVVVRFEVSSTFLFASLADSLASFAVKALNRKAREGGRKVRRVEGI